MKLFRFGEVGSEKPGLVDSSGILRDLSEIIDDFAGETLNPEKLLHLSEIDYNQLPSVGENKRIGSPVADIGKIVCIGLNYHDHAAEVGKSAPDEPMLFLKATSSVCGPYDDIEIPQTAEKVDWETELAIVIGRRVKNIDEAAALSHIAGFMTANDVSERAFQGERSGQFTKGKSHDTFCPLGPWLVTKDECADIMDRRVWTDVNGTAMQNGSTSDMVFNVTNAVSYISEFMTLEAGDIILTGTPAGVGKGMKPDPVYLNIGDSFSCGVEGLGEQTHTMIGARS